MMMGAWCKGEVKGGEGSAKPTIDVLGFFSLSWGRDGRVDRMISRACDVYEIEVYEKGRVRKQTPWLYDSSVLEFIHLYDM